MGKDLSDVEKAKLEEEAKKVCGTLQDPAMGQLAKGLLILGVLWVLLMVVIFFSANMNWFALILAAPVILAQQAYVRSNWKSTYNVLLITRDGAEKTAAVDAPKQ